MVNVNENIRFLRKKKGWTQEKFSQKIGIKRSLVGAYEEGRSDPRLNNLLKMCDVFSISLDNILKKDISKPKSIIDIIKIERKSRTAVTSDYYRICKI